MKPKPSPMITIHNQVHFKYYGISRKMHIYSHIHSHFSPLLLMIYKLQYANLAYRLRIFARFAI